MSTLPKLIISTLSLPSIPLEERPSGCGDLVWRYSINPIIKRKQSKNANSIFDSATVPFNGGFAGVFRGVFRVDERTWEMNLRRGFTEDGVNWKIDDKLITFIQQTRKTLEGEYKYDPSVVFIEDRYWFIWFNGYHSPTIGVGYTYDFETFYQLENAFLPYNGNGTLFPRKINGKFAMLSRSSDTGHTSFGDIFYSEGPNIIHWGVHRFVMGRGYSPW